MCLPNCVVNKYETSQTRLWVLYLVKFLGGQPQDISFLSDGILWSVHQRRQSLGERVVPHRVFSVVVVLGCVLVADPVLYTICVQDDVTHNYIVS